MILDALLQLSGGQNPQIGQAVTTTTAMSTNTFDMAATPKAQTSDYGMGNALEVYVGVTQSAAAAGAATVTFQLLQADDSAMSSNLQVIAQTDAVPIANLTAGSQVVLHYDRATPYPPRRYVAVRYVVGNGPLTAGAFTASLVKSVQDRNTIYPAGFSIL